MAKISATMQFWDEEGYINKPSMPIPQVGYVYKYSTCECAWRCTRVMTDSNGKRSYAFRLYECCGAEHEIEHLREFVMLSKHFQREFSKFDAIKTLKNIKRHHAKVGDYVKIKFKNGIQRGKILDIGYYSDSDIPYYVKYETKNQLGYRAVRDIRTCSI